MTTIAAKRLTAFLAGTLVMALFLLTPSAARALTIDDLFKGYYQKNSIPVLCYHDVYPSNDFEDEPGISVQNLEAHLQYLKDNDYNVLTLDQYIVYTHDLDEAVVPPKTILLSFDDGYESIYKLVFPLLKKFNYPAIFSIVGSWADGVNSPEGKILSTWPQLQEMEASGLAEMVSHSYNLHYYDVVNPHGDYFVVANARIYEEGAYETKEAYIERITDDFDDASASFQANLGRQPRAIVWPYGECNAEIVSIAKAKGMKISFVLADRSNVATGNEAIDSAGRYVMHNDDAAEFAAFMAGGLSNAVRLHDYTRASQVDIDDLYVEGDAAATDRNIDKLIVELRKSEMNTVFLQAFADSDGSGNIRSVYFYTTHAPVKADVFSHVASRLKESGFMVIAWMNTLSCQWLFDGDPENKVTALSAAEAGWYGRATPFSEKTRNSLLLLFDDLSTYAKFDGVLFQDDLYLNDFEDFSPPAAAAFSKKFNRPLDKSVLTDEAMRGSYVKFKTETLIGLTRELTEQVRKNIHYAVSMRNIYSEMVTAPEAEEWFAQNFRDFIANYDYTVVMAYPYMDNGRRGNTYRWLSDLVQKAVSAAGAENGDKFIIKVQTYDWSREKRLSNREIVKYLRLLEDSELKHSAIYPHKPLNKGK